MNMSRDDIRESLDNLQAWREAYYNGTPIVVDAVYDAEEDSIRDAILTLPEGDSLRVEVEEFLARVGAPTPTVSNDDGGGKWQKVKHKVPMGSLNKAQPQQDAQGNQDHQELRSWLNSLGVLGIVTGPRFVWSDKCDGISIALYYTDGELVQAVTRGDGEEGEDITTNVLKMKGIVRKIKGYDGFIRGEIVLRKSDWKAHFPTYANPRNAASGIAKRQSGGGQEHLTVLHYQMIRFNGTPIPSKYHEFKVLVALGAAVPSWGTANSLEEVEQVYLRYIAGDREALDYDIDGLVIEINDNDSRESFGSHNNRPKAAIAYKFPHDKKPTRLITIQWQVGNTGRVTPVAIFEPVKLAGATVSQASLHNVRRMEGLRLSEGCRILVSRRNDVIPMVEANLDEDIWIKDIG